MKRYLLIPILICLCFGISYAWLTMGPTQPTSGLTPPSYYASAILSMNFEEGLNAFDTAGDAVFSSVPSV